MIRSRFLASLFIFIAILGIGALVMPYSALAATEKNCKMESSGLLGLPTWYKYLLNPSKSNFVDPDGPNGPLPGECKLTYPKNDKGEEDVTLAIVPIALAVTEILLRVGTYLAVGVIVWAGFQYQLSQGDPERTKASRTMILNALIGLVIAMFATVIVNIIGRNVS